MIKNQLITVMFLSIILVFAEDIVAKTVVHENKASGLLTWTSDDVGFRIEFIQLLPDFVRAIYAKHHFPGSEIERIAGYCVFGTILKNTADGKMTYRVKDWRYRVKDKTGATGKEHAVKTKTQWLEEWRKVGIKFSWTLLPDIGEFEVGDWQQGFTTIALPRDSEFDLIYRWEIAGVMHTGTVENMRCAPESLAEE